VRRRRLGRTPFEVGRLSLGCATFGREIDEAASFGLLDFAIEAGINLLDTSEGYGGGQAREGRRRSLGVEDVREVSGEFHSSELIIGRWLAQRRCRERIILQTKALPPLGRARIGEAIDASLRRLQTHYLDLFLFHAPDPATPLRESLEGLVEPLRAGKIRAAGCSNFSAGQLREAIELSRGDGSLPRLEVTQFNYNLAMRDAEAELLPLCAREGVGVQTYSPLGAGFLTGKYDPVAQSAPAGSRFDVMPGHRDVYFQEEKFRAAQRLREHADRVGVPVAQLAVAWVLGNPAVDTVLIGARTTAHIESALAAESLPPSATADL